MGGAKTVTTTLCDVRLQFLFFVFVEQTTLTLTIKKNKTLVPALRLYNIQVIEKMNNLVNLKWSNTTNTNQMV